MDLRSRLEALSSGFASQASVTTRLSKRRFADIGQALEAMDRSIGPALGRRTLAVLPDCFATYLVHLHHFLGQGTLVPLSITAPTTYLESVASRVRPNVVVTTEALFTRHRTLLERMDCIIVDTKEAETCPGIAWRRPERSHTVVPSCVPNDVRLILFTSGSTGLPKGVCLSEANVLAAAGMNVAILSLDADRTSVITVPLYDYYGMIQIYSHLAADAALCLGESVAFVNDLFLRLETSRATDLVGVPYGLRKIFQTAATQGRTLPRQLTRATSSSDTLSDELLALIFSLRPDMTVFNIFGLTEAGRACCRAIRNGDAASRSIGRPSPGVEITCDAANGGAGELIIRGPNVMLGYLKEVAESGEIAFDPCREVRTADLGYVSHDGEVFLLGRRDHLMNLRGIKVHPAEIESAAYRVTGVRDARAYLASPPAGEPVLWLDIVCDTATGVAESVKRVLRSELPNHCQPREIRVVDEIPRTELGSKIVRR